MIEEREFALQKSLELNQFGVKVEKIIDDAEEMYQWLMKKDVATVN